ncbi:hypothetical protein JAAARDRAFT_485595 [Jaapia argillacea MUCL 33604]|uniref:NAD(P)-binding protein n=1 Tax=Jaapia argillacea MUCL 33604 TaxID=933084 RepID=A0A067PBS5_9AGAM|nr:hypothetical protein JAAARDRAFT_485595 [Jaapia argillacea MUCL 33604]
MASTSEPPLLSDGRKVWFNTGTSTGFGRCLVSSVLSRGDYVVASARSLESIQDFPKSDSLRLLQLDVNDGFDAIGLKVDEAVAFWGRIDVLVNNAGTGMKALLEEGGSNHFKEQFHTNVFSALDVTNAVLPHMRPRKSGTIVMIGSRSSWNPEVPGSGAYCASKAALRAIGETLSVELAPFNIRVLIVEPGAFRTNAIFTQPYFTSNPIPDYDDLRAKSQAAFEAVRGKQPGDPAKAMEAVLDVVRGEGRAKGRSWPTYLPLGEIAEKGIKEKCSRIVGVLDEWADVVRDVNFDS